MPKAKSTSTRAARSTRVVKTSPKDHTAALPTRSSTLPPSPTTPTTLPHDSLPQPETAIAPLTPPTPTFSLGAALLSTPAIVDLLVAHLPKATLPTLRGVSRPFHDAVSAVLYRHVHVYVETRVHPKTGKRGIVVQIVQPFTRGVKGRGNRIPGLKWGRQAKADHELCINRMRMYTRVLDLGAPSSYFHLLAPPGRQELFDALAGVTTIRSSELSFGDKPNAVPFPTDTHIAFFNLTKEKVDPPFMIVELPDAVRSATLSISFNMLRTNLTSASIMIPDANHARVEDVTLVFRPYAKPTGPWRVGGYTSLGFLKNVVQTISLSLPRVRYTLVGLERFQPEWLNLDFDPAGMGWDQRKVLLVGAIHDEIRKWWGTLGRGEGDDGVDVERALRCLSVLTQHEYRDAVGAKTFALVMAEPWQVMGQPSDRKHANVVHTLHFM